MSTTIPVSDIDLFDDAVLADPYATYEELRDLGAAVWLERHKAWAIPRYAEVRAILRDHETFSSSPNPGLEPEQPYMPRGDVLGADPPDHERLRRVLADQLLPRALRGLGERIAAQADELVAGAVARGSFDAIEEIARRFPVDVVADLVGLGPDRREDLLTFADAAFNTFGPFNERTQASLATVSGLLDFMQSAMSRESLRPGSWGAAAYAAADRGEISHEDAGRMMGAFVVAGMDTTVNAIGSAIWLLAQRPDRFAALRADPGLAKPAFEETLRYESPVIMFARGATRDTEIGGTPIAAGDRVVLLFGSANRDERRYPDAEQFEITRNPLDHVAFGYGIHVCVGAGLARMEGPAILAALARRVERLELDGEPRRHLNNVIRGLAELPVTVTAA
ncbi:MAG: cytochrome P450 [Solirubrobacteraceae bacterium]